MTSFNHPRDALAYYTSGAIARGEAKAIVGIPADSLRIYDNGGKTFDRYTCYYLDMPRERDGTIPCRGMSDHPSHPQGFGQFSSGHLGRHNGRRIAFAELPADCQALVVSDCNA